MKLLRRYQARTFDMRARPMVWKEEFVTRGTVPTRMSLRSIRVHS
jgi:hypothetical protein